MKHLLITCVQFEGANLTPILCFVVAKGEFTDK